MMSQGGRVIRVHNSEYHRSGRGSYVYLIRRWEFEPTLPGPFAADRSSVDVQSVPHIKGEEQSPGRKSYRDGPLRKCVDASDKNSTTVPVSSEDQQNDTHFTCPIHLGKPGEELQMDFDILAKQSWVHTSNVPASGKNKAMHGAFIPENSTTCKQRGPWKTYFDAKDSISGITATELIQIEGLEPMELEIGLVSRETDDSQLCVADGVLGLSLDSPVAQTGLFTAKVGNWRDPKDPEKKVSFFTFGFIHEPTVSATGDSLTWSPLASTDGLWRVHSAHGWVDGEDSPRLDNTVILDTVGPLALVDDNFLKAIYAKIPGSYYDTEAQGYLFPASIQVVDLPRVEVEIGNKKVRIQKKALGFCVYAPNKEYMYGGFQSRGNLPFDVFGDTFLQGVYAAFDAKNRRLGIAAFKERTDP